MEKTPIPSENPSEESVRDISTAASEGNPFNGLDNSNADENAVNLLQVISATDQDQDGSKNVTIKSEGGDSRSDAGLLPDLNEAVNDESNGGSMVEVNLLNLTHAGSSSRANENGSDGWDGSLAAKRIWICPTCERMFPTAQALGGHQNAHKQERELAKISGRSYGRRQYYPSYYYPYAGFSANPFVGSLINNRSLLGVRPDSMIHKPSFGWSPHGYRSSYGGWSFSRSNTQNSPTPMSLDWLRNKEGFLTNKSGSGTLAGNTPNSASATTTTTTAATTSSESTEGDGLLLLLEAANSIARNKSSSSTNGSNPISEGDNQVKSEEPPRPDKSTEEPPRTDKSEESPENDDSETNELDLMLKL